MINFKELKISWGTELEVCDIDRRMVSLTEGCSWNTKEVTLINSNGKAVNSRKDSNYFEGGEINTPPTASIDSQYHIVSEVLKALNSAGTPSVNYRCNAHIHAGIKYKKDGTLLSEPELLDFVKRVQKYSWENYEDIIKVTMGMGQLKKPKDMPHGTWQHYQCRRLPEYKHNFMMEAKTMKEFQMCFFKSKANTHAPLTFLRQFINLHCMFKYGTVEFRHFWGTLKLEHIGAMLFFCEMFLKHALDSPNVPVKTWAWVYEGEFAPELLFDIELEKGYHATKVKKP